MYSCWYENNPTPEGDEKFPLKNLVVWCGDYIQEGTAKYICIDRIYKKYYDDWKWRDERRIQIRPFMMVDPALSESPASCNTAIVVAGKELFKPRIWLLEVCIVKSEDPRTTTHQMVQLHIKYNPLQVLIEDQGYQLSIKTYFEEECKKNFIYAHVETIGRKDHRKKDDRILGLRPFWQDDNLIMRGTGENEFGDKEFEPEIKKLIYDELHRHPHSKTRDIKDALARILDVEYGTQRKGTNRRVRDLEVQHIKNWK